MSWTINENSKTSTTEYFNANYSDSVPSPGVAPSTVTTAFTSQNAISGYSSGTISFTVSAPPSAWIALNMIFIVMGKIDTNIFIASKKTILAFSSIFTTFYVEWDIPLQDVALRIVNNCGLDQSIENIRIQTESSGGGASGVHSSSGSEVGPGGLTPEIQFNDGGIFGGAKGALYDSTTEQIQLANGSVNEPMLAFSDGTHPNGNYDTGIYRIANDAIGISCGNSSIVGVHGSNSGNFIKGVNVGQTSNICGIRRLSATPANSWEDGWMGNSTNLVFTGSDFTNNRIRGFGPVVFGVAPHTGAGNGARGFIMGAPAAVRDNEIIAVKLLPKGFRVAASEVLVYSSAPTVNVWGSSAGATAPSIQLFTQDILTPTAPTTSLGALQLMATWASGINSDYTPGVSAVGTGTLALVVRIVLQSTQQITSNDGLVGVSVAIERR